ncbi:MAG: hypothetical protein ACRDRI_05795 [Pseudonocardiaceae bacterium]
MLQLGSLRAGHIPRDEQRAVVVGEVGRRPWRDAHDFARMARHTVTARA